MLKLAQQVSTNNMPGKRKRHMRWLQFCFHCSLLDTHSVCAERTNANPKVTISSGCFQSVQEAGSLRNGSLSKALDTIQDSWRYPESSPKWSNHSTLPLPAESTRVLFLPLHAESSPEEQVSEPPGKDQESLATLAKINKLLPSRTIGRCSCEEGLVHQHPSTRQGVNKGNTANWPINKCNNLMRCSSTIQQMDCLHI